MFASLGAIGCMPSVAVDVRVPDCVPANAALALAIEPAPCGDRAEVAATVAIGEPLTEPLTPGRYCVDAVAYLRDDDAGICRLLGVARENRRLPSERDPLELSIGCAAPTATLGDDLLAGVAGCTGACDVERCVCAGSCDPGDPLATCAPPIDVDRLVMGDHFGCGLDRDRRRLWCWGDEEMGAALGGVRAPPGVAVEVWPLDESDEYVAIDAGPDVLCVRTATGQTRCGDGSEPTSDLRLRGLFAVGDGFVCRGYETNLRCSEIGVAAFDRPVFDEPIVAQASAGLDTVCGVTSTGIVCRAPLLDDVDCADGTCWWRMATALVPTRREDAAEDAWARIDLGWGRGCATTVTGRLVCWSERAPVGGLPAPRETVGGEWVATSVELGTLADSAREVSVGTEHLCVRRLDDVVCGVLTMRALRADFERSESFPGEGAITSFVAGPHGISCAVRVVDGVSRVECFQLAGFTGGEALLGHGHTRDLVPGALDPDRADLVVCP